MQSRQGSQPVIGSFQADLSYSDYSAHSYPATLTLESALRTEDFELEARVFQDLDGDQEYSPGADRLLAKSEAPTRNPGSNSLSLSPISFTFKPRHEPVGIHWVVRLPSGEEITRSEMFR
jgi:hypothetical protein